MTYAISSTSLTRPAVRENARAKYKSLKPVKKEASELNTGVTILRPLASWIAMLLVKAPNKPLRKRIVSNKMS